ncbi:flavodoxin family protein [[Clostridium] symbiosum]|uniref:flavodoxin family protein n=1 Tax=Clostridium symbiosum TaxID=1512 RepID=UPI001D091554|nr:flavodoxin family protein [[Clostridium] symbiosum]MCB6608445.1 flavodoxin family protein [[Clostridium] symbiosum]MCB6930659.1 flavodoxin family protein [[Clostridium] symbiosum]
MNDRRVLAIAGSPRRNGVTSKMLECAVNAAERNGWKVDKINLYEKHIEFCSGCRSCLTSGMCVRNDDIQEIAALLQECDTVILAAPVYWANVPAAVKNMFDRLLGVAMEETGTFPKPRLSERQKYVLLTACNTPFPFSGLCGQSSGALRTMREFFKTSGMKCGGKFVCTNTSVRKEPSDRILRKIEKYWER